MSGIAFELVLLLTALLLLLSVAANRVSSRFGVPALLPFLAIGMLAGADGPGGIYFDDARLSQSIGVLALVFILFSGGLDTDWRAIRPVLVSGLVLANLGVLLSTLVVGGLAAWALGLPLLHGLLLGAIISSTDAAAVFAVMRASGVHLGGRLEALAELESGSNDPIAVFLTTALIGLLVTPGATVLSLVPQFFVQMALGAAAGLALGYAGAFIINRIHLSIEGLYPALTVALMLLAYGGTAALGGNGFLAVYIAGIVLGNRDLVHKRSLLRFHDACAWLMQIAMFLVLGLLVFPSQLVPVAGAGMFVAAVLIVVARPVSVFAALAFARFSVREKLMIAWIGLRGAAPIVLATFPLLAGVPEAGTLFNLVFFVVLTSVLVQGTTIPLVGRWLGLNRPAEEPTPPRAYVPAISTESRVAQMTIPPGSPLAGRTVMELGLPPGALIVAIDRANQRLVPSGATVLQPGDRLLVLADEGAQAEAARVLSGAAMH